jgi:hypothetical protein
LMAHRLGINRFVTNQTVRAEGGIFIRRIAIKSSFLWASTPTNVVMFFTTGSFRLRLWRREALTRDHRWHKPPCRVR